jgi:hypothetical protein
MIHVKTTVTQSTRMLLWMKSPILKLPEIAQKRLLMSLATFCATLSVRLGMNLLLPDKFLLKYWPHVVSKTVFRVEASHL